MPTTIIIEVGIAEVGITEVGITELGAERGVTGVGSGPRVMADRGVVGRAAAEDGGAAVDILDAGVFALGIPPPGPRGGAVAAEAGLIVPGRAAVAAPLPRGGAGGYAGGDMTADSPPAVLPLAPAEWRDFFALTKPRVMSLVIFTGLCGLLAAPASINAPGSGAATWAARLVLGFTAILCIALGAGGAAALNQWWEADIDAGMKRTRARPLPAGRMVRSSARDFGVGLSAASVVVMGLAVGWLPAAILAVSIVYYAVVYTIWLKPRTPQNIVIGGGAGAFPPMIGWVAATGHVTWMPVVLFAIIFIWTPPHFWALALFVKSEYAKVGIPMMPVVAGERSTRRQILGYAVVLLPVSLLPWWIGGAGAVYGAAALGLGLVFVALAARVGVRVRGGDDDRMVPEKRLFAWSVIYLFALFAALVIDRWWGMWHG